MNDIHPCCPGGAPDLAQVSHDWAVAITTMVHNSLASLFGQWFPLGTFVAPAETVDLHSLPEIPWFAATFSAACCETIETAELHGIHPFSIQLPPTSCPYVGDISQFYPQYPSPKTTILSKWMHIYVGPQNLLGVLLFSERGMSFMSTINHQTPSISINNDDANHG